MSVIKCHPRAVGRNGGWASLVTGQMVDNGPDLAIFVQNRSDAYALVDLVTPPQSEERNDHGGREKRVDRAYVDYRDFEPHHLQVKLIVEAEHEEVLHRLAHAISLRDGYLDESVVKWAIDPENNRTPYAIQSEGYYCDAGRAMVTLATMLMVNEDISGRGGDVNHAVTLLNNAANYGGDAKVKAAAKRILRIMEEKGECLDFQYRADDFQLLARHMFKGDV